MKAISIDILVAAGVLVALFSVLGMWRMRDPYQKMHFISPPAALSPALFAIAILLQDGLKPECCKAVVVTFVLIGMNTVVTHAAARAFRISEAKDWRPSPGEEVPILPKDELVGTEQKK